MPTVFTTANPREQRDAEAIACADLRRGNHDCRHIVALSRSALYLAAKRKEVPKRRCPSSMHGALSRSVPPLAIRKEANDAVGRLADNLLPPLCDKRDVAGVRLLTPVGFLYRFC